MLISEEDWKIDIETPRLIIRPFNPDDWRDLYEYLSQPETVRFEPYGVYTVDEAKEEARRRAECMAFRAVCLKQGGSGAIGDTNSTGKPKLIGNIYFEKHGYGNWGLGYVFNSGYLRKGYATEAARAVIDYAVREFGGYAASGPFSGLGVHRVTASCDPQNTASWRLLERLGFRREGHLRSNVHFHTDKSGAPIWKDTYLYAMLAEDWPVK